MTSRFCYYKQRFFCVLIIVFCLLVIITLDNVLRRGFAGWKSVDIIVSWYLLPTAPESFIKLHFYINVTFSRMWKTDVGASLSEAAMQTAPCSPATALSCEIPRQEFLHRTCYKHRITNIPSSLLWKQVIASENVVYLIICYLYRRLLRHFKILWLAQTLCWWTALILSSQDAQRVGI